jgi:hypothetical protein
MSNLADQAGSRVELTTIRARDPADRRDQVLFRHGHPAKPSRGGPIASASR